MPGEITQNPPWFATYRLQVNRDFPLAAAAETLPYLHDLGISHVYLSPCLQAAPGSMHGYDVADPTRVNDEIGGEPAWESFIAAAKAAGLGVLLDIVPNHMTTHTANVWWSDVLTHGPFSEHATAFDLFPYAIAERWEIAICTLGQPYGKVLEQGELEIDLDSGLPRLRYYESTFPLGPASWRRILGPAAPDLAFVLPELAKLRQQHQPEPRTIERYRLLTTQATEATRALLADPGIRTQVAAHCADIVAHPDQMHALLEDQFYRLAWWKLEGEIINYRRFFNIGTLVGVRVESPAIFDAAHARIARMVANGDLAGLRVDHPDGLRDPREYFDRLRQLLPDGRIYAEKILDSEEKLPDDWAIDGTVGYEFLSKVNRLWMDEEKADAITAIYADFTGHPVNYPALVREKKREIIHTHFTADLERLTTLAGNIAQARWTTHDLSRAQLEKAIAHLIVSLPVYRTYLTQHPHVVSAIDKKIITDAVAAAIAQSNALVETIEPEVFAFLDALLTNDLDGPLEADFIARWQQLAPAVMAKGAEDTTFYCYDRLVSCNEVGSQPSQLGIAPSKFHQFCAHLQNRWPHNLLPTSTHDTKRSEDVRTRISVLTEIPERWNAAVLRWSAINQSAWRGREPDRHAEFLLYQTLIGAWPISFDRAWQYLLKSCREAKIRTTWHEPNIGYEEGLREFTETILADEKFTTDLATFVEPLVRPGRINSLAQTLVKLTAPGTPDFYQGTELWDLSLVDPDNRRPVDFAARRDLLARVRTLSAVEALADWDSGLPKLFLIQRALAIRHSHAAVFNGVHQPISARGSHLGHVMSYRRGTDLIVSVPRFTLTLGGDWGDTVIPLPPGAWRSAFNGTAFTGDTAPADLFAAFPVALLTRET
ncbi:MAG TPA: malto-oligosyltrehalose synthase [Chthoniobacterales bacterium]